MDFGYALNALREGRKVTRPRWAGSLFLNSENKIILSVGESFTDMEWIVSQADILAEDWMLPDVVKWDKGVLNSDGVPQVAEE